MVRMASRAAASTALCLLVLLWTAPAAAQPSPRFEAGVQVVAASLPGFEGSDFGVGGRLAWHTDDVLSFEGELNLFPGDYPDSGLAFSRRRVEGLFGVTAGVRLGRVRPFAKFRAGFLDVQAAGQLFPCILIFPPPLSCTAYTLASWMPAATFTTGNLKPCHSSCDQPARCTSGRERLATPLATNRSSMNNCTWTRSQGPRLLTAQPEIVSGVASPKPWK